MMYFPPEILSNVLSHQPKTELKTARLVCKAFDAAAVPFLFKDIYLIARYADMEKASLLASQFGSYVKTLTLSSETFDSDLSLETFRQTIPNEDLATSYHDSYRKLEEEQKELLSGGEFFGHLCNTLTLLLRLEKVVLTNGRRTEKLCWCQQAYIDGHSRNYDSFLDKNYAELKSLRTPPKHICITSINGFEQRKWNVLPQILCALYTTGNTKVKAIATVFCRPGPTIDAFCITPRQSYCTAKILPNLTSLDLYLDFNCLDSNEDEIYSDRVISRTLAAATNLESLVIVLIDDYFGWEQEEDVPTTFELMLGGCNMPKLVTFALHVSVLTESEATNFLRHSPRIKHMSLVDDRLTSGSWEKLFNTIKASLALESFNFNNLISYIEEPSKAGFDCENYNPCPAIKKFLLGCGPNPFSVAALEHAATENPSLRKQRERIEKE